MFPGLNQRMMCLSVPCETRYDTRDQGESFRAGPGQKLSVQILGWNLCGNFLRTLGNSGKFNGN